MVFTGLRETSYDNTEEGCMVSCDKNAKSNIGYTSVITTVLVRENQRVKTHGRKVNRLTDRLLLALSPMDVVENAGVGEGKQEWETGLKLYLMI
jgi:hypothetical protein